MAKRNLEDFFKQRANYVIPGENAYVEEITEPTNYVERDRLVRQETKNIHAQDLRTAEANAALTEVKQVAPNKTVMDSGPLDVGAVYVEPKTKMVEREIPQMPVEAPLREEPILNEAPEEVEAPVEDYTPLEAPKTQALKEELKTEKKGFDTSLENPWMRALVGATPLLVGLLTGNKLEGVQTSADYFTKTEQDLWKRDLDLNDKLRALASEKKKGASNYNKVEVFNPKTKQTEIWSTMNGQRHEFLGLKGVDPVKDKFDKVVIKSESNPNNYEIWSVRNGEKFKKIGVDYKKDDVVFKEAFNPTTGKDEYKMFTKAGDDLGFVAELPKGAKRSGLTLEERMALKAYEKELKDDEIKFKQTRDLNKDREGVLTTKNTRELAEAHGKIMETSFGSDPINDTATIFALFKMLDPGSVVRESEQALGMAARSYDDLVTNVAPILMKQRYLTPNQVKNIRDLAQRMYEQQLRIQESSVDALFRQRAKKYGLDENEVAPVIRSPFKEPVQTRTFKKGNTLLKIPVSETKAIQEALADEFEEIRK